MGRLRRLLPSFLLSAASVVVAFLLIEAGLRLLGLPERYPATARMANARWTLLLDCYPTNPRGYFDIDLRKPANRDAYFDVAPRRFDAVAQRAPWAVEFRYNRLRFRDAALGPRPARVKRVMILGDSFTEGQGVKEGDTCARVLERLLNDEEPGKWEVRNCGRRGTDFPALYDAFGEILPFEPDLVIYALVLNDAEQSDEFHARQSYLNDWILDRRDAPGEPPPEPGPLRPRLFDFVSDRIEARRIGRETTRWYLEMWGPANREGWERTQGYLREMNRRTARQRARFLVAPWPLFVGLEGAYPFAPVHETIARFCLKEGIAHHDLLRVFRGRESRSFWVHPVDRHPNEEAHRMAAASLVPVVRDLLR
jgi:GDSL-like lipase/acylhydrolase family protein